MNNYSERIRGGSLLDADRRAEYSRDAVGYRRERSALFNELTAVKDAEFVEKAREIVATGGEPWDVLGRLALLARYSSGPTKRKMYDLVTWDNREPAVWELAAKRAARG